MWQRNVIALQEMDSVVPLDERGEELGNRHSGDAKVQNGAVIRSDEAVRDGPPDNPGGGIQRNWLIAWALETNYDLFVLCSGTPPASQCP